MAGKIRRGGTWHLRMRVPRRYASVERRRELHRTLHTGDEREANARLAVVERQVIAELDARLAGRDPVATSHYEAIAELAASRSFQYRTASELATGPVDDLLRRVADLRAKNDLPDSVAATALLGGVERPRETLLEVAERMKEISPLDVRDKTHKQRRVWMDRWLRPAKKVNELLGIDPALHEITRTDAIAFRDALQDSVLEGEMKGESAQKDIQNLNRLWKLYHLHLGLDPADLPPSPFRSLGEGMSKLDEEGHKREVPHDTLVSMTRPEALSSMNPELRDLILVLIETGARQSEVSDIPPYSIRLDDPIPHLIIRRETGEFARELKNKNSARDIPLVGVALDAMRRHPSGFPRYRGKGTFSAAANKYLKHSGILPEGVSVGGLRHSFEARLKDALVPIDDRGELMGHSVKKARGREVYGDKLSLEERCELHERIMIRPQV